MWAAIFLVFAGLPDQTVEFPATLTRTPLITPQVVVEDVIRHNTEEASVEDYAFLRYFSLYAVPKELRADFALQLSFAVHSLTGLPKNLAVGNSGSVYPLALRQDGKLFLPQIVNGNEALIWIDLRDYSWTEEAWEKMASLDGYFVEPVVQHPTMTAMKIRIGNGVVRGDWFIRHALDMTRQLDNDIDFNIYDTLLYAQTGVPRTTDEFRKIWGVDLAKEQAVGNEHGVLIENRDQTVSRAERMLFGYRTSHGIGLETYDVKNSRGKRNFLEQFFLNPGVGGPPEFSDAGELIFMNAVGMQVFDLRAGQNDRVEFGDPTVVRHLTDVVGDVRVRLATSCIDCHSAGAIPAENVVKDFLDDGALFKLYDRAKRNRIYRGFLNNGFEEKITEQQRLYEKALLKVNGLTPTENGRMYLRVVKWYEQPIGLEQAAFECGVTPEEFKEKVTAKDVYYGNTLKRLVQSGVPIRRDFWESPSVEGLPGGFQQAHLAIHGFTKIVEEVNLEVNGKPVYKFGYAVQSCNVYSGNKVLAKLGKGQKVILTGKVDRAYTQVRVNNIQGWVKTNEISTD